MTNFEKITGTAEALGAFLAALPIADGPWDTEFHRAFCDACAAEDCAGDTCPHSAARGNPLWWLKQETEGGKTTVTDKEKTLIQDASYSVIMATSMYCELLGKRMKQSDGSMEQIQEIGDSMRALNHATVAMERLCRILNGAEPGKEDGA